MSGSASDACSWPRPSWPAKSAIRASGVEKSGNLHERQQQPDDPVNMVVREQGDQRQDGNDFILHLLGPMGHVLGKGMKTQIQDPDQEHDQGQKDHHDIHENVGFTWSRDEKRQMVRCLGMNRRCHRPPPTAWIRRFRWCRGRPSFVGSLAAERQYDLIQVKRHASHLCLIIGPGSRAGWECLVR